MRHLLLQMIGIALLETAGCMLVERKAFRSVIRLAGGAAMTLLLLESVMTFDYQAYASALKSAYDLNLETEQLQSERDRLDRLYIERECAAYILNQAEKLGAAVLDASVSLSWNTDGFWYPTAAELLLPAGEEPSEPLSDVITAELGIAKSAQVWREEGGGGS